TAAADRAATERSAAEQRAASEQSSATDRSATERASAEQAATDRPVTERDGRYDPNDGRSDGFGHSPAHSADGQAAPGQSNPYDPRA
ncbi:MAG: hypothetical protein ABI140_18410, partial [Jatrophihabitantaceae bacterium]